ncbi:MAG: DUF4286 family protein [Gemmatimonadales bacterium]|jgi:hypothetical protein|nr:DUF4286 family protein [Gemmatimonadales bacterium]
MVRYEVVLEVAPERAAALEAYMRGRHIPEILATGCFRAIRFERAAPERWRTCYEAATEADLERYLRDHAAHFRDDFRRSVGDDARPTREVWREVEAWRLPQ